MSSDTSARTAGMAAGWRSEEESLLFEEVARGRSAGIPLKAVFEIVAGRTGRKPNSIRNYYYARVKAGDGAGTAFHSAAFVPFSAGEMRALLRSVLTAQAKGQSVRACTLEMGGGDTKAMLRYQNKYRSLIRSNPALVREVLGELAAEGVPAFDPYAAPRTRRGGHGGQANAAAALAGDAAAALSRVPGVDAEAFFHALCAISQAAAQAEPHADADAQLQARCEELRAHIQLQDEALLSQRERFSQLLALFRQMMETNRAFLGMASDAKTPAMRAYVRDLSRNVEDCERLLAMLQ